MRSRDTLSVLFLILVFAGICPAWAAEPTNSDCLECHGEASRSDDPKIPRLESQTLPGSVHGNLTCIECHAGIASLPHSKPLQRTDCSSCHEKQADAYRLSVHGLRPFTGDIERDAEEAAKCVDCHGTHDTQPVALFRAPSHRLDIPDRCGECHPDIATTYRKSVHGQAAGAGTVDAPICTDCHGEHTITSPSDPTSRVAPRMASTGAFS